MQDHIATLYFMDSLFLTRANPYGYNKIRLLRTSASVINNLFGVSKKVTKHNYHKADSFHLLNQPITIRHPLVTHNHSIT